MQKQAVQEKEGAVKPFRVELDRADFLATLEQVQAGLSTREIVQQSSCFVFSAGMVSTFNEEVACSTESKFPDRFKGAVQAAPLLAILRKIPDERVTVTNTSNRFVVTGKGRQTGVAMEKEVLLPVDSVEKPEKWKKIHEDFVDAVGIVQECASKDQTAFTFTCVHVHPEYMEACDNLQLTRYELPTGVSRPFLVRRDSLKHVMSMDVVKFSETEKWLHFKTATGTIMSCRRYSEKFEDLGHLLTDEGTPTVLPKALGEAAERCEIFSAENSDDNLLLIELKAGRLRVTGEGASGFHMEMKKLKYDGVDMKFRIAPKLLIELLKRHTDCKISKKHRLMVNGGKFRYCACLEKTK
jgi:DNA polymerase III sliding clamp (beta) subunit (PCNA family)